MLRLSFSSLASLAYDARCHALQATFVPLTPLFSSLILALLDSTVLEFSWPPQARAACSHLSPHVYMAFRRPSMEVLVPLRVFSLFSVCQPSQDALFSLLRFLSSCHSPLSGSILSLSPRTHSRHPSAILHVSLLCQLDTTTSTMIIACRISTPLSAQRFATVYIERG